MMEASLHLSAWVVGYRVASCPMFEAFVKYVKYDVSDLVARYNSYLLEAEFLDTVEEELDC